MNAEGIDVSIIIVNWNTRDLLAQCLHSLYETDQGIRFEVIVVDNGSEDGSAGMVRNSFPQVRLIENTENLGFAGANNQAMAISRGRYMLLFNSDALATPGAIQTLISLAEAEPYAGIVGAQLLNLDGSFQASYTPFPTLWQEFLILSGMGRLFKGCWYPSRGPENRHGPQVVDYVEGACMLVRRQAYEEVGGLDQEYFMYAEEVDWCYTMEQAGWQVWYQPAAKVFHVGGGSSKHQRPEREADLYLSRVLFFRKHYTKRIASLLKLQIYCFTAIKSLTHWFLRLVTKGRYGRQVVTLPHLATKLNKT